MNVLAGLVVVAVAIGIKVVVEVERMTLQINRIPTQVHNDFILLYVLLYAI